MKKYTFIFFACFLLALQAFSQTSIQLTRYPLLDFRVSGVFDINLVNLSAQGKQGTLKAVITNATNSTIVAEVSSSLITLEPGLNQLTSSAVNKTATFYDTYVQTTDRLGTATHEVCITFSEASGIEPVSVECTNITPPPYSLPYLVYPYHESVSGEKHPNLMWSVALAPGMDVKYKLELAEILNGQLPNDAIINNYKLVQSDLLGINNLFYPATAQELAYGKSYAWQVSTFINGTLAGKTEVWSFSLVQDTPSVTGEEIPLNYIILSDINLEGIYTTKDKKLFLELDEKYVYDQVSFTIYEDGSQKKQVCELTESRKTGLNLYTLALNNCEKNLKKDVVYYLAVKSNNKVYQLKFRVKS